MRLRMFAVYDNKAGAFLAPFFMPNVPMAVRIFTECASDDQHMFGRHPNDYTLFELAEFDDNTARITPLDVPNSLGLAAGYRVVDYTQHVNDSVIPSSLRKSNGSDDPNHQEVD